MSAQSLHQPSKPNRRTFSIAALGSAVLAVSGGAAVSMSSPAWAAANADDTDIDAAASYQVLVNKLRPLNPLDFQPSDLVEPRVPISGTTPEIRLMRDRASQAAEAMFAAAKLDGIELNIVSAYRSFQLQTKVFNYFVERDGQKLAETYSARPGYSEHQTGLTMDISAVDGENILEEGFANEPAGKWAAAHCQEFGFILRYPQGFEATTGYIFEPWHFRYIGIDGSTHMKQRGILSYEEFTGSPAAPNYLDPAE